MSAGRHGPRARMPGGRLMGTPYPPRIRRVDLGRSAARGYSGAMAAGRRKHWGWGYEHEQPPPDEVRAAAAFLAGHPGFGSTAPEQPVPPPEVTLPPPRLTIPEPLRAICATHTYERAFHAYGSPYQA